MTPDDQLTARALSRDTCIVLPTYNERENLPPMVRALLEVAPHVRLLVVDDASPDGTGQVADAIASSVPERVTVLHRQAKTGLGDAYVAGFRIALASGAERIFEMDADFSHPVGAIPAMLRCSRNCATLSSGPVTSGAEVSTDGGAEGAASSAGAGTSMRAF